jgi:hypothetical protein
VGDSVFEGNPWIGVRAPAARAGAHRFFRAPAVFFERDLAREGAVSSDGLG